MSYKWDIVEELHALKPEAGHALKTSSEEWQKIWHEKAHSLAAELKTLATRLRSMKPRSSEPLQGGLSQHWRRRSPSGLRSASF